MSHGNGSSYLPLNAAAATAATAGNSLTGFVRRHKTLTFMVIVSTIISVQVWFLAPAIVGEERMDSWRSSNWGLGGWSRPPPPPLEGMDPQKAGWPLPPPPPGAPPPPPPPPPPPVTHGKGPLRVPPAPGFHPVSDGYSGELGPDAFPAQLDLSPSIASFDLLYPQGDPHKGVIPEYWLRILQAEPRLENPPWPPAAPEITSEMYTEHYWDNTGDASRTSYVEALHPEWQPIEQDWRSPPYDSWRPPLQELASNASVHQMPRVQYPFQDPSRFSGKKGDESREALIKERRRLVKNAFLHAWGGYKKYAWGHDELKPVSGMPQDNFNGWGATIVDALDTLLVMELPHEYDLARQHVRDIDFHLVGGERSAYATADGSLPVFETAIRYLGGFLAAYDLSGDELMKDRAEQLAQLIMPAFHTRTGVPIGRIRFDAPLRDAGGGGVVLAEAGSLLLEYTRLWQVTGNRTYFDRVQRTTDWLDHNITASRLGSLLPTTIYPDRGTVYGPYSFGGQTDSYYEYLIKQYQLLGGRLEQYGRMYSTAIDAAKEYLFRQVSTVPNAPLLLVGQNTGSRFEAKLEHLACFSGGMLGLGSRLMPTRAADLPYAKGITETCWWAYNSSITGIGPEEMTFYGANDNDRYDTFDAPDGTVRRGKARGHPVTGVRRLNAEYRNRPETIESVYYMWRITGDEKWQERGWQMFSSWVTHCMTEVGFSSIRNVMSVPAEKTDSMESFTFAETFKYYYLLFSPPELISLDDYIFTTEAHPLLAPKNGIWAKAGHGPRKFWNSGAGSGIDPHVPVASSGIYSGGERGPVSGLTNNQKQAVYRQYQATKALEAAAEMAKLTPAKLKEKIRALFPLSSLTSASGEVVGGEDGGEGGAMDPEQAAALIAARRLQELDIKLERDGQEPLRPKPGPGRGLGGGARY